MDRIYGRRALQLVVAMGGLLPVGAALAGIFAGPGFLHLMPPWPVDLDSHFRFLSGVFLVVGLGWWSCIPAIEGKTERLRLLAAMTVVGGLARLHAAALSGLPSIGHCIGLGMELVVVPAIVVWQAKISRIAPAPRR